MISLLLATVLSAGAKDPNLQTTEAADRFWRRDLAGLVGVLAQPEDDDDPGERALFADLVRLIQCEPMPALDADTVAHADRALVRLELARRSRLGDRFAKRHTVWRDLLNPAFFQRALGTAPEGTLIWPVETEAWSGEDIRASVLKTQCVAQNATGISDAELALANEKLISELTALGPDGVLGATRVAYLRAVLLWRAGKLDEARVAAAHLIDEVAQKSLGELAPFARLLRLELGLDPAAGYAELMPVRELGPALEVVRLRNAAADQSAQKWPELIALTSPLSSVDAKTLCAEGAAIPRDLIYRRAMALQRMGQREALDALLAVVFPACVQLHEPAIDALRELAFGRYATLPLDPALIAKLRGLGAPSMVHRQLWLYAQKALAVGNGAGVEATKARLLAEKDASSRTRGWALEAQLAIHANDARRFDRALAQLFPDTDDVYFRQRDRDERDRAALELAEALVADAPDLPAQTWRAKLKSQLELIRQGAAFKQERNVDLLMAALSERPPEKKNAIAAVGLGDVSVTMAAAVPPPPAIAIEWPEPFSLLAIPTPAGGLHAWFDAPVVAVNGADHAN